MKKGFTLLEMSIVLAIIALIIGAVLISRSMIRAAELRKDVTLIQQYTSGVDTFKSKYLCMPGDCSNATSFFTPGHNGDGNGTVDGLVSSALGADPSSKGLFWWIWNEIAEANNQLAQAGLIPLQPFNSQIAASQLPNVGWIPLSCSDCGLFLVAYNGKHYIRTAAITNTLFGFVVFNNFQNGFYTPEDAYAIDGKIDDGFPLSGKIQDWFAFEIQSGAKYGCETTSDWGSIFNNVYNVNHAGVGIWGYGTWAAGPCALTIKTEF